MEPYLKHRSIRKLKKGLAWKHNESIFTAPGTAQDTQCYKHQITLLWIQGLVDGMASSISMRLYNILAQSSSAFTRQPTNPVQVENISLFPTWNGAPFKSLWSRQTQSSQWTPSLCCALQVTVGLETITVAVTWQVDCASRSCKCKRLSQQTTYLTASWCCTTPRASPTKYNSTAKT